MDTQNEEETTSQETVTPEEDTNEETQEPETQEEETEEPEKIKEVPEEWKEKFKVQSSNAQRKITEANEKMYQAHLKLAEKDASHIEALSLGDDKDVKIAKQLSKQLYQMSLDQVLIAIKPEEETKEQIEKRLRTEIERDSNRKATKTVFIKSHPELDETSPEYNEAIANEFQTRLERYMGNEIMTIEETNEALNDAFYLANRGGTDPTRTQERIATAGGGASSSTYDVRPNNKVREIEDALAAVGVSPLSAEAKKLLKKGLI